MENQEIKIGFGENGENDYESEIIIRDSCDINWENWLR